MLVVLAVVQPRVSLLLPWARRRDVRHQRVVHTAQAAAQRLTLQQQTNDTCQEQLGSRASCDLPFASPHR
jgi:hypothetical protein